MALRLGRTNGWRDEWTCIPVYDMRRTMNAGKSLANILNLNPKCDNIQSGLDLEITLLFASSILKLKCLGVPRLHSLDHAKI